MRSGELARRAGVTVRALRHYHQLGLLEEPLRSANGYRQYSVRALVRVLQIKRLAGLGLPLHSLPDLLDGDPDDTRLLDRLDDELARQIQRLAAQRAVLARLRQDGIAADLPPELGRQTAALVAAAPSPGAARIDREQAILLGELSCPEQVEAVAALYSWLAEPARLAQHADLNARFAELGPESEPATAEALVRDLLVVLDDVLATAPVEQFPADLGATEGLLLEYSAEVLNDAQLRVLAEVQAQLTQAR